MGAGSVAVVVRAGVLRCVAAGAVADVVAGAVRLDAVAPEAALPPVVAATIHLGHPTRVTRLAARFLRRRLDGSASTLVLRSRSAPEAPHPSLAIGPVAPLPVAEAAMGASFDLVVPIGEPARHRYAGPAATLVASPSLSAVAVARRLADHRAFLGPAHCAGDVELVRLAEHGAATDAQLAAALDQHEAAVVVEMVRATVRAAS